MTVLEVIKRSTEFLTRKGVESPRLQVELILAHVLKLPRLQLYLNFERKLDERDIESIREMIKRRGAREPLQHITGSTSFCGLEIAVNRDVLVPRPETELLAERGWKFLQNVPAEADAPKVLDFGTGSGCIAIALAIHAPRSGVWAVDTSKPALAMARANAERHGAESRIQFIHAASLCELDAALRFDLVISNPPYIPAGEIEGLDPEVREFDPRQALDGGTDGLKFYSLLAAEARERLKTRGSMMLEFGDGQAEAISNLLSKAGWDIEAVERDLSGRERILVARPG